MFPEAENLHLTYISRNPKEMQPSGVSKYLDPKSVGDHPSGFSLTSTCSVASAWTFGYCTCSPVPRELWESHLKHRGNCFLQGDRYWSDSSFDSRGMMAMFNRSDLNPARGVVPVHVLVMLGRCSGVKNKVKEL